MMKTRTALFLALLLALSAGYALVACQPAGEEDDTLVVYVAAHPDDIEYSMSASLYRYDYGRHPLLCLGVTDGGGDRQEHRHDQLQGYVQDDAQRRYLWKTPDGNSISRPFYSSDLARKRVGGYFSGSEWVVEPAQHETRSGSVAHDWLTRMNGLLGCQARQLSYPDPEAPNTRWLYPDGALDQAEALYTHRIAQDIAATINQFVEENGHRTDLLYVATHAPEEVARNAGEHGDHRITGNAVREAINLLQTEHGFGEIVARWYTAGRVEPKVGYERTDLLLFGTYRRKSKLWQATWETAYFLDSFGSVSPPPVESYVEVSYRDQSPTPRPSANLLTPGRIGTALLLGLGAVLLGTVIVTRQKGHRIRPGVIISYTLMVLLALVFLIPTYNLLRISLAGFYGGALSLENYVAAFRRTETARYFFNSTLITLTTILVGLVVNSLLAYVLARTRWRWRVPVVGLVVALMIVPLEAMVIPLLLLTNSLNWLDSYHVQIVPFIADPISIFLFYQFFNSFPRDLEDAAFVDGVGHVRMYWQIVAPLSWPAFATVAIMRFLFMWDSYLWPLMVTRGPDYRPLTVGMQMFTGTDLGSRTGNMPVMAAYAVMMTIPMLLLFLLLQKWFVQGVTSTGIEG